MTDAETKWEYLVDGLPTPMALEELNRLGSEGWQLCAVAICGFLIRYHFKRVWKKPSPEAKP